MSALWADPPIPAELVDAEPLDVEALDEVLEELASPLLQVSDEARRLVEARPEVSVVLRWSVSDDADAEWALRRLAEKNAELADLEAKRDAWTAKITAWFDQASTRPRRRARYFEANLEDYALRRRAETGVKSLRLPSGKVSTRHAGPKVVVRDEAAFRAWALENPDHKLVRLKAELVAAEAGGGEDKALRAVEREVGLDLVVTLTCGHNVVVSEEQTVKELVARLEEAASEAWPELSPEQVLSAPGPASVLGRFECREHDPAAEGMPRGEAPSFTASHAELRSRTAWVAVLADEGEPVSWAAVEHPEPTAKVDVR